MTKKQNNIIDISEEKQETNLVGNSAVLTKIAKLSNIQLDDYDEIMSSLSEEARLKLKKTYNRFKLGASVSVPLICPGSNACPHYEKCPFAIDLETLKKVIGKECPYEYELFISTVNRLLAQFEVREEDIIKMTLITEYAELEIYDARTTNFLTRSENASLITITLAGEDKTGAPITVENISTGFLTKEKIKKRKDKILEELVATPKAIYKKKAVLKEVDDTSIAKQKNELKRLIAKIKEQVD